MLHIQGRQSRWEFGIYSSLCGAIEIHYSHLADVKSRRGQELFDAAITKNDYCRRCYKAQVRRATRARELAGSL